MNGADYHKAMNLWLEWVGEKPVNQRVLASYMRDVLKIRETDSFDALWALVAGGHLRFTADRWVRR